MRLTLSDRSPINAVYRDETGQAIYKVTTPYAFTTARLSTISRILPSDTPSAAPDHDPLHDRFGHLATVEHHTFRSSLITHAGHEFRTAEYFKGAGWGWYGRHRTFVGPDGRDYRWHLGGSTSWLTLNNKEQTMIAKFHPKNLGIMREKHPAYLEVFPTAGDDMLDHILITFIFIEKMRKDKERSAKRSGGGD